MSSQPGPSVGMMPRITTESGSPCLASRTAAAHVAGVPTYELTAPPSWSYAWVMSVTMSSASSRRKPSLQLPSSFIHGWTAAASVWPIR